RKARSRRPISPISKARWLSLWPGRGRRARGSSQTCGMPRGCPGAPCAGPHASNGSGRPISRNGWRPCRPVTPVPGRPPPGTHLCLVNIETDVTIIGSGFAGSITAMALRARGLRVLLLERGRHPRFAIGESTTPLTNLLIEELADAYDLPHLRPFSKWGTWQAHRPDLAVGLKRGFTFAFHDPNGRNSGA